MEYSKLTQVFPMEQILIPQEMTLIHIQPEEIEAMILKLREDHLTIQPIKGPVEEGDFVMLMPPKGGESFLLNTARPMGNMALAEACLGCRTGEAVSEMYLITSIKRRFLPEFNTLLVQKANIPDIHTTEQYRTYCLEALRSRKTKQQTKELAQWMETEWLNRCQFHLDEAELEAIIAELEGSISNYMETENWSREKALEMFAQMLNFHEEGLPTLRACGERLMQYILLGQHCLEKYGVILDRARYEKALEKLHRTQGVQLAELRRAYPYSMFLHEKASTQINTEAQKFIKEHVPFRYE